MSMLSKLKRQFSTVIEWGNPSMDILWQKNKFEGDEVINASKLILAPGQGVILVYEGKIDSILTEPGIYNLKTDNHPFITALQKVRQLFESEHKLYIYFYRTTQIIAQDWGTPSGIKYIDPVYKFPVELGMYGSLGYQLTEPEYFYTQIIGNLDHLKTKDFNEKIISIIPTVITQFIAQRKLSYIEIDSNLVTVSQELQEALNDEFVKLGINIIDFKILGSKFDETTQAEIKKLSSAIGDLNVANTLGLSYVELEKLRAMRDAARNEGLAGAGIQMGVGMELGKNILNQTEELIDKHPDIKEKLKTLQILVNENIITQEDYEAKKQELLSKL